MAASEAAKKGAKLSKSKDSSEEEGSVDKTAEGAEEKDKGIGSKLKKLFGR